MWITDLRGWGVAGMQGFSWDRHGTLLVTVGTAVFAAGTTYAALRYELSDKVSRSELQTVRTEEARTHDGTAAALSELRSGQERIEAMLRVVVCERSPRDMICQVDAPFGTRRERPSRATGAAQGSSQD